MMNSASPIDTKQLISRVDALIRELHEVRRQISVLTVQQALAHGDFPTQANQARELYGAMGKGSLEEYDLFADWERFGE